MADAGHDDPRAPAISSGVTRRRELGAQRRERLAHRRQIAGAVIDERNHSSPFVLGSIFAMPLVFRARHPQRARERLEARLDLVMVRASVHHLEMHVGARAHREALEEIVHELRSADRRPAGRVTLVSTTVCGRPPRSMAATASVSSIGITK